MQRGNILLIMALFTVVSWPLVGVEYRRYDVRSGLSNNGVLDILQDKDGYIWLATKDGLNRFGGTGFTVYGSSGDGSYLYIESICPDADENGLWVAADSLYLFDKARGEITLFSEKTEDSLSVKAPHVLCLTPDGFVWIGAGNGVFCWDGKKLRHYEGNDRESQACTALFHDSEGVLWAGVENNLLRYVPSSDSFRKIATTVSKSPIYEISESFDGKLWIGYGDGTLASFDKSCDLTSLPRVDAYGEDVSVTRIHCIFEESPGTMLVGADNGLFRLRVSDGVWEHSHDALSEESVYKIIRDVEGGIWVGTYFSGVNYYYAPQKDLKWFYDNGGPNSLSGNAVSQFCEDGNGRLWIATENGGVNLFDPRTEQFIDYTDRTYTNNIHALALDGDKLWIGTFGYGLYCMNLTTGGVREYRATEGKTGTLSDDRVYCLYKDSSGVLLVGTMRGMCAYDSDTDSFSPVSKMGRCFVYDIAEDDEGNLWVATKNNGIRCRTSAGVWRSWSEKGGKLPTNRFVRVYRSPSGEMWFCAETDGIFLYDKETDGFKQYSVEEGLPRSIYYGILEDDMGILWLSSNLGIVRYDRAARSSQVFTEEDGFQGRQFNYRSSLCSSDGRFYFGGVNGFNSFDPNHFVRNATIPNVCISSVKVTDGNDYRILSKTFAKGQVLTLSRKVVELEITYDCLSFVAPDKNRFKWKLEGLYDDWINSQGHSAVFLRLKPGHYNFVVCACNNDGVWSQTGVELSIRVRHAIWAGPLAKFLYLILTVLAVWFILRHLSREQRKKKEEELTHMKIEFFTEVAHEIKTPVSLILAPMEQIRKDVSLSKESRSNLDVMSRNASRLLDLVHQLLDFRKADADGYQMHLKKRNICALLNDAIERFDPLSDHLDFEFRASSKVIECGIDEEAMSKVVSNLLSNATKYAESKVLVTVREWSIGKDRKVTFTVEDDGPGIPADMREKVLQPFHRVEDGGIKGFGIGLSIVKLLTEKHGGRVVIGESSLGGCKASVELPASPSLTSPEKGRELQGGQMVDVTPTSGGKSGTLLIVDDNPDMLDMLSDFFGKDFMVLKASDGEDALTLLKGNPCDIVISDLMMPRMNGGELLHRVREDELLSHIPFIILSVKDAMDTKVKALEGGADAYIEKPFSLDHLSATVNSILDARRRVIKYYTSHPAYFSDCPGMTKRDIEWLEKVNKIIEKNIRNKDFDVNILVSEMAMSRSSLQRKIKGLTDSTPGDYIKLFRLKKAAELLREGNYRVNEVCFIVGFTNNSYFTKCFFSQFGVNPKDYIKQFKKVPGQNHET